MNRRSSFANIKKISVIAMFCALAYVCMLFVKIPGIAGFLTLDIKDAVIVLCTLIFGPSAGLAIAVLVPFLEFLTISTTGVYGLIMNVLSSVTFSMVTGVIYKYKKSFYGAIIGLLSGVFAVTSVMILANLLVTPYYMGVSVSDIAALIPKVLLPFNLIKAILNGAIVLLLYKPVSRALKKTGLVESVHQTSAAKPSGENRLRSVLVTAVAVCVIAASLVIVFVVLK